MRAAVGLVGAALVASGGLATSAGAQDTPTDTSTTTTVAPTTTAVPESTTTTVPYDPSNFPNGEARASADTFELNIKQGNANIGLTYGRSLSSYADITGTSEARALDLGVLPVLLGGEQCDGSPPVLNPATFPAITRADSSEAGADVSRRTEAFMPGMGTAGPGPSAGFGDATAVPGPTAVATTESADADVFIVAMTGGRTQVTTSLVDDVRSAEAVVTADELRVFGGLFTFHDPKWEAVARSGRVNAAAGRFSFSSATVLGFPRPADSAMADLAEFKRGLEELLAPLGVVFELPSVKITPEGRVTVSPMAFRIVDPPWGAQVIAPFLADIQPLKDSLIKQALDEDCKNETQILLLDVILGIVAGSGSVEIEAGGVDVSTDDTEFPAPRPPAPPAGPSGPPVTVLAAGTPEYDEFTPGSYSPGTSGTRGTSGTSGLSGLGADELTEDLTVTEDEQLVAGDEEALSVLPSASSSRFEDSDAGRAAVAVGLVALLGALGLTVGERFLSRRSSRRIP